MSLYRQDVVLGKSTWFGVGGAADHLFRADTTDELSDFVMSNAWKHPITPLGLCSNVIIRDGGISGAVVKLGGSLRAIALSENGKEIVAGCGASSAQLSLMALNHGLTGLEFCVGIPGSVGGLVAMNAGCYGGQASDLLLRVEAVSLRTGKIVVLDAATLGLSYRHNDLAEEYVFTRAFFRVMPGASEMIKARMSEIEKGRGDAQPTGVRTGGSTFKNPPSLKAWELIDAVGMRGYKLGGAEVSQKHANFLIASQKCAAYHLECLGELIRNKVLKNQGIQLEWEIKRLGRS